MENENKEQEVIGELLVASEQDLFEFDEESHLKSHGMIFSALDLGRKMQDVMALMFTRMKESDWATNDVAPVYTWDIHELSKWFATEPSQIASVLRVPAKSLAGIQAGFEDDNGDFSYKPLFKEVSYKKKQLTIIPNERLKEQYLVNASDKGFAKVDNKIFLDLHTANAKRIFDIISRFKGEYEMYPMTVERLQIYLGILSPKGKVLKKTYACEREFIKRIIKPAMKQISSSAEIKDKLEIIEKEGILGYELSKTSNGKLKIKFNVRWLSGVIDKSTRKEALANIDKQMMLYREILARDGDGLPHLEKIKRLLKSIHEPTEHIDNKIQQIQEERKKLEIEKEEKELNDLESKVLKDLLEL